MKRFFSLSVAAVVASSLIMGGCSDGSENLPTAATDALEEEAEWVRVDLKLSSEHPYGDNQDENWELQAPQEAQGIRVHFNEFETEEVEISSFWENTFITGHSVALPPTLLPATLCRFNSQPMRV